MTPINLRNFYGILGLISALAAAQSMVFPRWPNASDISTEKFNQFKADVSSNGHVVKPLSTLADHSDYNLSHTPIISLKIDANSELFFTNVQVRDRKDLDVPHITQSIKSLHLKPSATKNKQPPFFLSEITPSGTTFQTCLVPGSPWPFGLAVDQNRLTLAIDQIKSSEKNLAIKRFLGFSPSRRYQCILFTLKTTLPAMESNQLWLDLLRKFHKTLA
jgi:hypothetical protein